MGKIIVILPFATILAALLYGLARAFGQIWLEHRIRMALLEKIEKKPELLENIQELFDVFGLAEPIGGQKRQNYALTGVILALMGAGFSAGGRVLHSGRLAVGIYTGGWICVALGILLFIVGLFIHRLSRQPSVSPHRR